MALRYHPDRNHSSSAKDSFIAAYEAYRILVDPLKRDQYDKLYSEHNKAQRARTATPFSGDYDKWTQQARAEGDLYSKLGFCEFLAKALVPLPSLIESTAASLPVFLLNLIFSLGWYVYSIRRLWIERKLIRPLINKYPRLDRVLGGMTLFACMTIGMGGIYFAGLNFRRGPRPVFLNSCFVLT